MAEDFRAKVTAELDTAEAESKLNAYRAQLKNAQQEYNAGNLTKEQLKESVSATGALIL